MKWTLNYQGGLLGVRDQSPESNIEAPALTAKDRADLVVGVRAGVDFVALSFVRTADDIQILREALDELGRKVARHRQDRKAGGRRAHRRDFRIGGRNHGRPRRLGCGNAV